MDHGIRNFRKKHILDHFYQFFCQMSLVIDMGKDRVPPPHEMFSGKLRKFTDLWSGK